MSKKEYFVIWDLDGTLLDTEGVSTKVIETVTKDYLPDDYIIDPYIWTIYWLVSGLSNIMFESHYRIKKRTFFIIWSCPDFILL